MGGGLAHAGEKTTQQRPRGSAVDAHDHPTDLFQQGLKRIVAAIVENLGDGVGHAKHGSAVVAVADAWLAAAVTLPMIGLPGLFDTVRQFLLP
jgi:hypothetical protein